MKYATCILLAAGIVFLVCLPPVITVIIDRPGITVYQYRATRFNPPGKTAVIPGGRGIYGDETIREQWLKAVRWNPELFSLSGFHSVAMKNWSAAQNQIQPVHMRPCE